MAEAPNNQSWKLGVADDVGRYGAHIPGGAQATNIGMTSHPMTYYAATPLRISGQDKALTSGTIPFAIACVAAHTTRSLSENKSELLSLRTSLIWSPHSKF